MLAHVRRVPGAAERRRGYGERAPACTLALSDGVHTEPGTADSGLLDAVTWNVSAMTHYRPPSSANFTAISSPASTARSTSPVFISTT